MLRGDVHRFYERLRRRWPTPPSGSIPELDHVREIARYYQALPPQERRLLLAWARKEESGIGLIPAALSGIPLLALIFAPMIQESLRRLHAGTWSALWLSAILTFTLGIYIHQRQSAYTALHVKILEQLCEPSGSTRQNPGSTRNDSPVVPGHPLLPHGDGGDESASS